MKARGWLSAAGFNFTMMMALVVAGIGGVTRNPYALGFALVMAIAAGSGLIAEAIRIHTLATVVARRKGRP